MPLLSTLKFLTDISLSALLLTGGLVRFIPPAAHPTFLIPFREYQKSRGDPAQLGQMRAKIIPSIADITLFLLLVTGTRMRRIVTKSVLVLCFGYLVGMSIQENGGWKQNWEIDFGLLALALTSLGLEVSISDGWKKRKED